MPMYVVTYDNLDFERRSSRLLAIPKDQPAGPKVWVGKERLEFEI